MKNNTKLPWRLATNRDRNTIDREVVFKYTNDYNTMVDLFNNNIAKWNEEFDKSHPPMENYNCPEYNNYIARLYQNLIDTTIPSQRYIYYTVEPDLDFTVTCHVRATGEWMRWEVDVEKANKMLGLA